jgi:hypothetical protein
MSRISKVTAMREENRTAKVSYVRTSCSSLSTYYTLA